MSFVDEVFADGAVPVVEDVSPFCAFEDHDPESHMDAQGVE